MSSQSSYGTIEENYDPSILRIENDENIEGTDKPLRWKLVALLGLAIAAGFVISGKDLLFQSSTSDPSLKFFNNKKEQESFSQDVFYFNDLEEGEKVSLFKQFKDKFGKKYVNNDEEADRYEIFLETLSLIDERNELELLNNGTGRHGVTKFADLTDDERDVYNGFLPAGNKKSILFNKEIEHYAYDGTNLSYSVNWAGIYTSPVKDQGYCGSCWAFSAIQQLESDAVIRGLINTTDTLSPQQIVSCSEDSGGCTGGIPTSAYEYVYVTGGVQSEEDYPYSSYKDEDGDCVADSTDYKITLSGYFKITNEDAMVNYVLSTGPLSVCVDASNWHTYSGGVLSVCGSEVNHCVQAVGVDVEDVDNQYWVIRNSWGSDWGVSGYIYIQAYTNLCEMEYLPTFTLPEYAVWTNSSIVDIVTSDLGDSPPPLGPETER